MKKNGKLEALKKRNFVADGWIGAANPSCRTMLNLSNTSSTSFSYVLLRLTYYPVNLLAAPGIY